MLKMLLAAVLVVLLTTSAASAGDGYYGDDTYEWVKERVRVRNYGPCDDWWNGCDRWRWVTRWSRRERRLPEVVVYASRERERDERRRGQCLAEPISVLSTEHTLDDHAKEAARKLWMARVQWEQGSVYMNLDEAVDVRWRCGPSNAHDTFSSRLSEAAGKLVGREGQNVRCALSARPCRDEVEKGRKDR